MNEYYTPAVVLGRVPRNDKDYGLILYTKELGKMMATAKSIRKITSKLAGHLRSGNLVDVRLVDKGSHQLIDGLSEYVPERRAGLLRFLSFIDEMTPYGQQDLRLWYIVEEAIRRGVFSPEVYGYLLRLMGFSTEVCQNCRQQLRGRAYFYTPDTVALCSKCLVGVKVKEDELVEVSQSRQ